MKYKKFLAIVFSCLAIGSFAGCSNDTDTYAQDKGSTVQVASTTQGIAIGDVKGNTDADRLTLSGIQAISDIKGARKDFLDEYFKNDKKVTDYDKWLTRCDDIMNRINNTITTISNLKPDEKASDSDKNNFNISKDATIKFLDGLNKSLAKQKSEIQSVKNRNSTEPVETYAFNGLSIYNENLVDTDLSVVRSSGWNRKNFYILNRFNGKELIAKGNRRCAADFIPKYNLLITYTGAKHQNFNKDGSAVITLILDNIGDTDFDMSKMKLVLSENGKEHIGDVDGTNATVTSLQSGYQDEIDRENLDATIDATGTIKPGYKAYCIFLFKDLGRSFYTAEGAATSHMVLYYNDEPIWMGDLMDIMY